MSIFTILFTAALVNNFVLSQFLGICPFLGVSKKVETAAGMGGAVVFVITIASFITSLLYNFLLLPNDLVYLNTIVFILVIAALVQFVEMVLKKMMPALYQYTFRLLRQTVRYLVWHCSAYRTTMEYWLVP